MLRHKIFFEQGRLAEETAKSSIKIQSETAPDPPLTRATPAETPRSEALGHDLKRCLCVRATAGDLPPQKNASPNGDRGQTRLLKK
jgi:hypothetical protein